MPEPLAGQANPSRQPSHRCPVAVTREADPFRDLTDDEIGRYGRLTEYGTSAVERDRRLEADVRGLGERVARLEARTPESR